MDARNRNVWIIVIVLLVVVACCCLAGAVGAGFLAMARSSVADLGPFPDWDVVGSHSERVEETFEVGDAPQLTLANFAGTVTIRSGQDGVIHVVATKKGGSRHNLEQIQLDMTRQDDGLVIKTRKRSDANNTTVAFEITVPPDTRLEIDQGAGEVDVRGLAAPVEIDNGAGTIVIHDVAGVLDVQSGAGSVDVTQASGPVRLDLGAGDLRYEGNPAGDCRFHTAAGNVNLRLPRDLNMRVDLSTGLGEVHAGYAVAGTVRTREVRGVVGDGSQGSITASSGLGNVNMRPQ